jgi:hypothetical protein
VEAVTAGGMLAQRSGSTRATEGSMKSDRSEILTCTHRQPPAAASAPVSGRAPVSRRMPSTGGCVIAADLVCLARQHGVLRNLRARARRRRHRDVGQRRHRQRLAAQRPQCTRGSVVGVSASCQFFASKGPRSSGCYHLAASDVLQVIERHAPVRE